VRELYRLKGLGGGWNFFHGMRQGVIVARGSFGLERRNWSRGSGYLGKELTGGGGGPD